MSITFGIVLLIINIQCSQAGFVESPSGITQTVGSVAKFRCQHQSLNARITWLVNGSLSSQFPNVSQINTGGVSTLTIPSVPEYNGTVVVCEALIRVNGSPVFEPTPPAILTVIADSIAARGTVEPMTVGVITTDFLTVPSPPVLIVTMEERHVYMCNHSETINIFWRVNGSRLNVEIFPIGISTVTQQLPGGGRVYTLTIGGRLEHNATTIQCSARLSSGSEVMTPNVSFLMQGQLQSVVNIERRNETINWEAPFSLNLTNIEPDIVYCVEMYNITCGRRKLNISDCDVMETSYTSDTLQPGYIYEYTVTPRSNVEGAQNGTSKTITERFSNLHLSRRGLTFSLVNNTESGESSELEVVKTTFPLDRNTEDQRHTVNVVGATSYSLSLKSLDLEEKPHPLSTLAVGGNNSVILEVILPYRRLCNYTVLAYDCEEHPLTKTNELSTHDIQNISVTSHQPGEVRVTGDFIDGSTATGLLIIIYSLTNDSDVHYITGGSTAQQPRTVHVIVPGLAGGVYVISVFVVEENGLPFERVATSPKLVAVETNDVVTPPSSSIEYSLQFTSTGVCITCTFLDSSATDCVVVVHQRNSQLNPIGLMNIESSHMLTRSGDTASGCIEGVNMEDYQVGVVGGIRSDPLISRQGSNDYVGLIVGSVFAVLFVLVSVVLVIVPMVLICKTKGKRRIFHRRSSENSDIELAKNDYVECPITKLSFEMTPQEVSNDERRELHPPPHDPPSPGISNRADHELDEPAATVPEPTYATPEIIKKPISTPPLEVTVKYDTVEKFKNPQGQEYAMVVLNSPSGQTKPDDIHKATSEYSQILHGQHPNGEKLTQSENNGEPKKHLSQCDVDSLPRETQKVSELTQKELDDPGMDPSGGQVFVCPTQATSGPGEHIDELILRRPTSKSLPVPCISPATVRSSNNADTAHPLAVTERGNSHNDYAVSSVPKSLKVVDNGINPLAAGDINITEEGKNPESENTKEVFQDNGSGTQHKPKDFITLCEDKPERPEDREEATLYTACSEREVSKQPVVVETTKQLDQHDTDPKPPPIRQALVTGLEGAVVPKTAK